MAIPATKESIIENSGSSDFAIVNIQSSVAIPATSEVQEDKLLLLAATAEVQEATSKKRKSVTFSESVNINKRKRIQMDSENEIVNQDTMNAEIEINEVTSTELNFFNIKPAIRKTRFVSVSYTVINHILIF